MNDDFEVLDVLTLRFDGVNENGSVLHELQATHVAEVLQGISEFTEDFEKAGVFHDEGPGESEILVRPAREGSFIIEVIRAATEAPDATKTVVGGVVAALGIPPVTSLISWATKSARADVSNFEELDNGNIKVFWQDDTVDEIPRAAWNELNKRKKRRKKQLRQIMAPLADSRVEDLEVVRPEQDSEAEPAPAELTLTKADHIALQPTDEVTEESRYFEITGRISSLDFDDNTKWSVKTEAGRRRATMEDTWFLHQLEQNMQIGREDEFQLRIREDKITKNERTTTKWTIMHVSREEDGDGKHDQAATPATD